MAKLERTYNIPLRFAFITTPKYKRAKKATNAVRNFIVKHMKSENVKLGNNLNMKLWEHGIKNPPHHIKVTAVKDDDGLVKVELFGFSVENVAKKLEKKEKKEKIEEKVAKEEKKAAEKKVEEKLEKKKVEEAKTEESNAAQIVAATLKETKPKAAKPKTDKPKTPKAPKKAKDI